MKHLKMIGLLVVAVVPLLAFASSAAAAPVLTGPLGEEYTGEIHATLQPGSSLQIMGGISQTCTTSTVKGTITTNNTTHAAGSIALWSYGTAATPCTKTNHVLTNGSLTISDTGGILLIGNEVTVFDLGVSCVYGGGTGTNVGTLTGGEPAVMDINTTKLPKISGGFLCKSEATTSATFTVTTPRWLSIT